MKKRPKPDINKPVPEGGFLRQSTNIEDRRTPLHLRSKKAPWDSVGYGFGSAASPPPNLNRPVPVMPWDDKSSVNRAKMLADRYRAMPPQPMDEQLMKRMKRRVKFPEPK